MDLMYDKTRRTIIEHPLGKFGYRKPPHWMWRVSPRLYVFVGAAKDIWLIVTGRLTLHRAWQAGHDHGTQMELQRTGSLLRPAQRATAPDSSTPEGRQKIRENARNYRDTLKPFA